MTSKVLIAEISGKRPGDKFRRPTEKFDFSFDKIIISNNSEGYKTDWPIVNVPDDYKNWYIEHCKMSDSAYYAPMNRSYAIKYARQKGYDYLIQLDDNIVTFDIKYNIKMSDGTLISYSTTAKTPNKSNIQNDMFEYMIEILKNTNVGMIGMSPASGSVPSDNWLKERYVYSAFILDLNRVPAYFQGDFEDDIEYRLKLRQLGVPSLSVAPFYYGKVSQDRGNGKQDTSGNREAYIKAGVKRGEHMAKLYGDMYERGLSDRGSGTRRTGKVKFRHKIKGFKIGIQIKNNDYLKNRFIKLLKKYATKKPDVLKENIIKPKYHVDITVYDKTAINDTLELIINMALNLQCLIDNPKIYSRGETHYRLTTDEKEKYEAIRNVLMNQGGVKIE